MKCPYRVLGTTQSPRGYQGSRVVTKKSVWSYPSIKRGIFFWVSHVLYQKCIPRGVTRHVFETITDMRATGIWAKIHLPMSCLSESSGGEDEAHRALAFTHIFKTERPEDTVLKTEGVKVLR